MIREILYPYSPYKKGESQFDPSAPSDNLADNNSNGEYVPVNGQYKSG